MASPRSFPRLVRVSWCGLALAARLLAGSALLGGLARPLWAAPAGTTGSIANTATATVRAGVIELNPADNSVADVNTVESRLHLPWPRR